MKLSVLGLIFLGLVAAVCATLLVASARGSGVLPGQRGLGGDEIEVLVAAEALEPMTVVDSSSFGVERISKKLAPEGALSSPLQLTGKLLAVRMTEGQLFTQSCLVGEGSRPQFAASLPNGMRAVSVSLSDYSGMEGLLYPGCLVDVLVAFDLPSSRRSKGEAVSTTLLHGIQVLAVENQTIVSGEESEEQSKGWQSGSRNRRRVVTVKVTPRQAEALQLAMEHGAISLSMRNPLDKDPVDVDATLLNEGKLAQLAAILDAAVIESQDGGDAVASGGATVLASVVGGEALSPVESAGGASVDGVEAGGVVAVEGGAGAGQACDRVEASVPAPKRAYEVTVIKGSRLEVKEFDQGSGEGASVGEVQ